MNLAGLDNASRIGLKELGVVPWVHLRSTENEFGFRMHVETLISERILARIHAYILVVLLILDLKQLGFSLRELVFLFGFILIFLFTNSLVLTRLFPLDFFWIPA